MLLILNKITTFLAITTLFVSTTYAQTVDFSSVVASGENPLELDPAINYIGGVFISESLTINGNGATIDLDGDRDAFQAIQVNNGATLTINNLTIQDGPFACLEVVAGSTLDLNGGSITGPGRGIHLREASEATITNTSLSGDYMGLEVSNNSNVTVTGCEIATTDGTAFWVEGSSTGSVSNCTFFGGTATGITIKNSEVTLTGSTIDISDGVGLAAESSDQLILTNCQFLNVSQRGLFIENMPLTISNVLITASNDEATTPSMVQESTYGLMTSNSPNVNINNLRINGIDRGLEIFDPTGPVEVSQFRAREGNHAMTIERMDETRTAKLDGLSFHHIGKTILNIDSSKASVSNLYAEDSGEYALRVVNQGDLEIEDSQFINCVFNGNSNGEGGANIELVNSQAVLLGNVHIINNVTETTFGYGIQCSNSQLELRPGNSVIGQYIGIQLFDHSSLDVRGCTLNRNGETIFCTDSDVYAEDCIIDRIPIGGQAIQAEEECHIVFRRNKVSECNESGLGLNCRGSVLVEDNYFRDLTLGGVAVSPSGESPSPAIVRRNTIYRSNNPAALYATGDSTTFSLNGLHESRQWGIHNSGTNNVFSRNFIFDGIDRATSLSGTIKQTVHHNLYVKGQQGLQLFSGPLDLVGNDFRLIGDGVGEDHAVFVNQEGNLENVKYNNFDSTTHHGLYAQFTDWPDATLNWWGDSSGPNENSAYGPGTGSGVTGAIFEPWLAAPAVYSWWQEDVTVTADEPTTLTITDNRLHGELIINSPTSINEMTSAMWVSTLNQTEVDLPAKVSESFGSLFATFINDARIHIDGGSVSFVAKNEMLASFGFTAATTSAMIFDEETGVWNDLPVEVENGHLFVTLPYHSASIVLTRSSLTIADYVDYLTGSGDIYPPDMNEDNILDVSDLHFFLFP